MTTIFARIRRPSLRWGLMFGIILGIVVTVYDFATSFVTDQGTQALLGYIPALLFIVLGFYAGLRASRETRKWTSGLVAGIWVGVVGALIADLLPVINAFIHLQDIIAQQRLYIKAHPADYNHMNPADYSASDVFQSLLLYVAVSIINMALYTVIGGALGGFIGRRRALAADGATGGAYQEAMFEPPASQPKDEASDSTDDSAPEAESAESAEVKDEAAK